MGISGREGTLACIYPGLLRLLWLSSAVGGIRGQLDQNCRVLTAPGDDGDGRGSTRVETVDASGLTTVDLYVCRGRARIFRADRLPEICRRYRHNPKLPLSRSRRHADQ